MHKDRDKFLKKKNETSCPTFLMKLHKIFLSGNILWQHEKASLRALFGFRAYFANLRNFVFRNGIRVGKSTFGLENMDTFIVASVLKKYFTKEHHFSVITQRTLRIE